MPFKEQALVTNLVNEISRFIYIYFFITAINHHLDSGE